MMTGIFFLILFGFSCIFPSEGAITSPPDGKKYLFLPGQTAEIKWEFDDLISALIIRSWAYKNGSYTHRLATLIRNGSADIETKLFEVDIKKPATLVLKNVNQSYSGTYLFSLTLTVPISSKVEVSIASAPSVRLSCPSRNEIDEGKNFTCVCRGEGGVPAPANVTWYKNGVQIGETKKESNTLSLTDVNTTDSGTFNCVAQSYPTKAFQDEKSVEVIVQPNSKPSNTNITFTPEPAVVGGSVEIICFSEGVPDPHFIILRPNGKANITGKSFKINKVDKADEGLYTCIATNVLGSQSATDSLTVIGPTLTTPEPTTIKPTPTTQIVTSSVIKIKERPTPPLTPTSKPPVGLIVGVIVGVLLFLLIVVIVVYCYKSKKGKRRNREHIDPVADNHYELNEEPDPRDNAYDTVAPVGESGGKKKNPGKDSLPPVYAAVDKSNRQGNTLYASLDTDALKRESKKEPANRTPQTEYASIDFANNPDVPKADLV